jgi:hypothetical protein
MAIEITSPGVEALIRQLMEARSLHSPDELPRGLLSSPAPSPESLTGAGLIAAMKACPYPEADIESEPGSPS